MVVWRPFVAMSKLTMIILLKLFLIAVSLFLVALLACRAVRNARRLNDGIEEYREELEAKGPGDPYAELAKLFEEQPKDKKVTGQ